MIVKKSEFVTSCISADKLPESDFLEIAFAGRSNVGKSSLINALLGRKNLARSGSRQGMTRLINFYDVNNEIHFVDLPGYGYAKVSKSEMDVWGKVITEYLNVRPQLYLMLLLIDVRREPSEADKMLYNWTVAAGLDYIVVATKCDKLSRSECAKNAAVIKKELGLPAEKKVVQVSAETKKGIPELWEEIDSFIVEEDEVPEADAEPGTDGEPEAL
ncbi:MAG: YihA family ribosome biogenesis GTP-binding protein [Clostridia bacterium]|nr:YihA family ribosome biogenesis GTP-binding protein [Clostridia bacterium]